MEPDQTHVVVRSASVRRRIESAGAAVRTVANGAGRGPMSRVASPKHRCVDARSPQRRTISDVHRASSHRRARGCVHLPLRHGEVQLGALDLCRETPGAPESRVHSDSRSSVGWRGAGECQPIVAADDGGIFGVEALLRWTHPVNGAIPPSTLIPLAEQYGSISDIGTAGTGRFRVGSCLDAGPQELPRGHRQARPRVHRRSHSRSGESADRRLDGATGPRPRHDGGRRRHRNRRAVRSLDRVGVRSVSRLPHRPAHHREAHRGLDHGSTPPRSRLNRCARRRSVATIGIRLPCRGPTHHPPNRCAGPVARRIVAARPRLGSIATRPWLGFR